MNRVAQLCLLMLTFATTSFAETTTTDEALRRDAVDKLFAEFDRPGSPGCAMAVMKDGKFAYRRGYGLASLEYNVPITTDTQFDIGSTSKQFTAASILLLAADGKLNLDDDIRKYIPEIPAYGTTITIRQMLHHTSGIRDYNEMMAVAGFNTEDWTTSFQALTLLSRQKALNFTPGSEFLYSNSGYFLLAIIVERISGKSMREFADERIFKPLGMSRTQVFNDHRQVFAKRATGYSRGDSGQFLVNMSSWEQPGDGAVQTTVEDLLKWDQNFYEPKVGGESLIRQLQETGTLNDGTALNYAAGLFIGEHRGLRQVSHGGAWAGYRAELLRFPSEHLSVAVLCNLDATNPSALALAAADVYLPVEAKSGAPAGTQTPSASAGSSKPTNSAKAAKPIKLDTKPLEGIYWSERLSFVRRIVQTDHKLMYMRGGGQDSELVAVAPDTFQMQGVPTATEVRFSRDAAGRVAGFEVRSEGAPATAFVVVAPFTPTGNDLKAFVGRYYSDEADNTYEMVLESDQLFVRDKQGNQTPLAPAFKDAFSTAGFGTLQFARNADGRVDRFSVSLGRSRGLVFTRVEKLAR